MSYKDSSHLKLFLCMMILGYTSEGLKILMLPLAANSHAVYFSQLGQELVGRGHSVTMLLATNTKLPNFISDSDLINVIWYQGEPEQYVSSVESSKDQIRFALNESPWQRFILHHEIINKRKYHWSRDCKGIFGHKKLDNIRKHLFDFVILDGVFPNCFLALAYKLGLPYALFSIPYSQTLVGIPRLPSQVPNMLLQSSDQMSFTTRIINFILEYYDYIEETRPSSDYIQKYVQEKDPKTHRELLCDAKLWLYLYDPIIDYPQPSLSNVVYIGDLMARKSNKLPLSLQKSLETAEHGVILVSFGSFLEGIPPEITQVLFQVLGNLKEFVIMKRPVFAASNLSPNILLMDWVPQNDILGHEKVKLFITHCGLNSIIESVYHAVPILGIPFAFDQPYNAVVAKEKGFGEWLQLSELNVKKLSGIIELLLTNKTYKQNVVRFSSALRDKTEKAGERASFWINHVTKYGIQHLKRKSCKVNPLQLYMFDLYLLLVVVFFISLFLLMSLIKLFVFVIIIKEGRNKIK